MISPISPRCTASGLMSTRVRSDCMLDLTLGWMRRPPYPNVTPAAPPATSAAKHLEERLAAAERTDDRGAQSAGEDLGGQRTDLAGVDGEQAAGDVLREEDLAGEELLLAEVIAQRRRALQLHCQSAPGVLLGPGQLVGGTGPCCQPLQLGHPGPQG